MKKTTLEVPTLYGDHHVLEVRRILTSIPGVQSVYASSSFHIVEVEYDEKLTNDLEISLKLDEAGYLGEWTAPIEIGAFQQTNTDKPYFRHTAVYETTRQVVGFAQHLAGNNRPLWPCPGFGVIRSTEE